jgi:hypothetical protein
VCDGFASGGAEDVVLAGLRAGLEGPGAADGAVGASFWDEGCAVREGAGAGRRATQTPRAARSNATETAATLAVRTLLRTLLRGSASAAVKGRFVNQRAQGC